MEASVRRLFAEYERLTNAALHHDVDVEALSALYATDIIGAGPQGVRAAANDDEFRTVLAQGFGHYRAIGTQSMRISEVTLHPIDDLHGLADVRWAATYARPDDGDVVIEFVVHYLVQVRNDAAQVFGWIAGDEESALRKRGIL